MLTFLRKIRKSLIGSGGVRKYILYAVGEVLLVMIGILLALQVNNWNENNKNNHRKKELLNAVYHEFTVNKSKLDKIASEHTKCILSADEILKMFPIDSKDVNLDTLRNRLIRATGNWTFEASQSRINFLINSSDFNLIEESELKSVLLSWESIYEDYHEDEQRAMDFNFDVYFPYFQKHFPYDLDFNNPRFDRSILETMEFESIIHRRWRHLKDILYNETNELEVLRSTIDKIIELTEPYVKHELK